MELNKFIKLWIKNGDIKIYDKIDYYSKVARLLRYHYLWKWGNHYFISEKQRTRFYNKIWDGFTERPRTATKKKTRQTTRNNFFYTLAK